MTVEVVVRDACMLTSREVAIVRATGQRRAVTIMVSKGDGYDRRLKQAHLLARARAVAP